MKVFAERIYPTEQYGNIKLHLEDDVHTEESTEQVMLRLVANLKLASVETLVYSKAVPQTSQTSPNVHTQAPAPAKPAPQAPAIDPKTVCPRCGKKKKAEYDVCFLCHQDDVEADRQ